MKDNPKEKPLKILATILVELNKAVKAFSLYPTNHSSLKEIHQGSFEKCLHSLSGLIKITFGIRRQGFFYNENPIPVGGTLKNLASELYYRRIKTLTFDSKMTYNDWISFVNILALNPPEIEKRGGVSKIMSEQGIKGIYVSEIQYERIVEKVIDHTERSEIDSDKESEGEEKEEEILETPEEEIRILPDKKEGEREEKDLDMLLHDLEEENNPLRYEALVREIVVKGEALKEGAETDWDSLFKILYTFSRHAHPDTIRSDAQKGYAYQGIKALFDEEVLDVSLRKLCNKRERDIQELTNLLTLTGKEIISAILDRLILEEDAYGVRNLSNLIVAIGEDIRGEVEKRLEESHDWLAKKRMVAILGSLGNPESLGALQKALETRDIRVKKEVIKALSKIKSEESIEALGRLIYLKDQAVALQAIISLGAIKSSRSLPYLTSVVETRGLSYNLYEQKKEAIRALGNISNPEALPVLIKILKTKRWWRRKMHDELRCLSAISIGKIGGDEAEGVLTEMMKRSKSTLYYACLNALGRVRGE